MDLKLSSYDYYLPDELIAKRPASRRDNSRLLIYHHQSGEIVHTTFNKLPSYLPKQSLTVFNQSKVIPARLLGTKHSGGKSELFMLSLEEIDGAYEVLIKCRGKKKIGDRFVFDDGLEATIVAVGEGSFKVSFNKDNLVNYLERFGKIPIPPYIRGGESDDDDRTDYQTIYARNEGSVAAPTAGLHFTDRVMEQLDPAYVNLHVGLGTFAPVKTDNLEDHKMHREKYFIDSTNLEKLNQARTDQRKIVAVGTTSLRVLESFWNNSWPAPDQHCHTEIFLHPGVEVNSIDALITNFHLPKSTLLMLVSSLIGREKTLELYRIAIEQKYRFFSYGDAMLILR